jgi:hypothetical protein
VGPLDPRYRQFLGYADGWRGFPQNTDLFGTAQLLGATPMQMARQALVELDDDDFVVQTGFRAGDLLPIGVNRAQSDLWLLARPGTLRAGQVLWYWGSDFEVYPDFDEFYLAMVDYNRLGLQRSQGHRATPPYRRRPAARASAAGRRPGDRAAGGKPGRVARGRR